MILFLYGEDTYRSRRQLDEIRAKYLKDIDPSGMNLTEIDGEKAGLEGIRAAVSASGFLVQRRLTVVHGAVKAHRKRKASDRELAELIDAVPDDTIAVFHEEMAGTDFGKSEAFARLKKERFYPEFTPLSPRQLTGWIKTEAKARGTSFTDDGLRAYLRVAGTDLWKVASELDKFTAFRSGKDIDAETVGQLAEATTEESLFKFLDMVGVRKLDRAAEILDGLLAQGEAEVLLVNRLLHHFRNLLVAADMARTEKVRKDRLVRELGIHPFVATKVLSQVRHFDRDELKDIYGWLIEADRKLKSGGWPKPRMAIDMLLLKLVRTKEPV